MLSSASVLRPPLHHHQYFLHKTLLPCLSTLQALTSTMSQCHLQNLPFVRTQQYIAKRCLSHFIVTAKSPVSSELSEQKFSQEGLVTESLPNGMFRIRLDNSDTIIGYISGKIRKSFIRILPGDRVKVEVSRYDTTRGRIVYRLRNSRDSS